jgi:hypothetical protein
MRNTSRWQYNPTGETKMKRFAHGAVALVTSLCLLTNSFAQAETDLPPKDQIEIEEPSVTLKNEYVRIEADDDGQYVLSTTGGDPATDSDNEKGLTYGFSSFSTSIWTSYVSVRIISDNITSTHSLEDFTPTLASQIVNGSIATEWVISNSVKIRQNLTIVTNPFSRRNDLVRMSYVLTNLNGAAKSVGLRSMLDVKVGNNDSAPYFVAGVGRSDTGQIYTNTIPLTYISFESPSYTVGSLKAQALLSGFGMTTPDMLIISSWGALHSDIWQPSVYTDLLNSDSATAVFWNPRPLASGASTTLVTSFGLAGNSGGATWLTAPAIVPTGTAILDVLAWVNNSTLSDFVNGTATISLPAGLSLDTGETAGKALGTVGANDVKQVSWRVTIDNPAESKIYNYSVQSNFSSGTQSLVAEGNTFVGELGKSVYLPFVQR